MPSKSVKYKNKKYTSVKSLAEAYGLTAALVVRRLNSGWSVAQAVGDLAPPKRVAHNASPIKVKGKNFGSIRQAAEHFGVLEATAKKRIELGWSASQVFGLDAAQQKILL